MYYTHLLISLLENKLIS